MRSTIEVVAQLRGGVSTVTAIRGGGHFAGRLTGPAQVHLVGTSAGPLGGDEVTIVLRVGAGAQLRVRSAAATLVQPGLRRADSRLRIEAHLGDAARLDLAPEPTVVCARAVHEAVTLVQLAGSAQVRVVEQVVLGRAGEVGGNWLGRTVVERDGVAVLRHGVRSTVGFGRCLATLVETSASATAAVTGSAVVMPLAAGGVLVTATGSSAMAVQADLERVSASVLGVEQVGVVAPRRSAVHPRPSRAMPA